MVRLIVVTTLALSVSGLFAQAPAPRPHFDAFEVATIKPAAPNEKASRYITMQGTDRFVEKYYTLKLLIAAAYDVSPRVISGGPAWVDSDHYDILAVTPGEVRPTREEQMAMLRSLIADRFKLKLHREPKEFSIYQLEVAKAGPRLKLSTASADDPARLISVVYPKFIRLPARNATMHDLASVMQRAIFDRPVVDKTGLSGRYDFDLQWASDETQFGGELPAAPADTPSPPLFIAMKEQLGLQLEATRGLADAVIIDTVERPSEN
ncbi:MAG TPA: TIGR03435 family protein [Acidobacteriaceae bacterium]